jgi:hypothetical protein
MSTSGFLSKVIDVCPWPNLPNAPLSSILTAASREPTRAMEVYRRSGIYIYQKSTDRGLPQQ